MPAFAEERTCFVSTDEANRKHVPGHVFHAVVDANRHTKIRMMLQVLQVAILVVRYRPAVVVSTGAAPGYWACRFGKLFGARTLWIDSIANTEAISLSGQKAGRFVNQVLTQWEHLASDDGPAYWGKVF
jgi:hypothetical protein